MLRRACFHLSPLLEEPMPGLVIHTAVRLPHSSQPMPVRRVRVLVISNRSLVIQGIKESMQAVSHGKVTDGE